MASRSVVRSLRVAAPLRHVARPASVRYYSAPPPSPQSSAGSAPSPPPGGAQARGSVQTSALIGALAALAIGGGAFLYLSPETKASLFGSSSSSPDPSVARPQADYQKVYNAIAEQLESNPSYDDGHYGPVLVRLGWHASGTYDKNTNSGGSNGSTMRFAPEASHGANAGLIHARQYMDKIHAKFPWISYSDLWTLGAVVAIQEMGGPVIPWRPGRKDGLEENCTPDGRLPDGDKGSDHLRFIFYRQGFSDQEIVALSGAHALGRCHPDRSGFSGPWTFAPTSFTNEYFRLLLDEKWKLKKWKGPIQYEDVSTKSLMMLTTDMALIQDKGFRPHVERYAKSEETFFHEFSDAFSKLIENGVPADNWKPWTAAGGKKYEFLTTAEQENKK